MELVQTLQNNAVEIAGALLVLINLINGLLRYNSGARNWIGYVIDLLSIVARKDSPEQSLKLPLAPSRSPEPTLGTVPPRKDGDDK